MYHAIEFPETMPVKKFEVVDIRTEWTQNVPHVEVHYYYPSSKVYSLHVIPVYLYLQDSQNRHFDYHKYVYKIVHLMDADKETEKETETSNQ